MPAAEPAAPLQPSPMPGGCVAVPAAGFARAPSVPAEVSGGKHYAEARRGSLDRRVARVYIFRI